MTEFGYRSESTSAAHKRMEAAGHAFARNKRLARLKKHAERAANGGAAKVALQQRREQVEREEAMAVAATGAARLLYEPRPQQLSMREIVLEVAAKHAVLASLIMSESRSRPIVAARQECFWRSRHELGFALTKIARFFHRDHTSVLHGERKHGLTEKPAEVPFA